MEDTPLDVHPTSRLAIAQREYEAFTEKAKKKQAQLAQTGEALHQISLFLETPSSWASPVEYQTKKEQGERLAAQLQEEMEDARQTIERHKEMQSHHHALNMRHAMIMTEISQIKKQQAESGQPVSRERVNSLMAELQALVGPQA